MIFLVSVGVSVCLLGAAMPKKWHNTSPMPLIGTGMAVICWGLA
jgi:hypothetical protein